MRGGSCRRVTIKPCAIATRCSTCLPWHVISSSPWAPSENSGLSAPTVLGGCSSTAGPQTGEHWSEKIAAEIGALLGIPVARVELAMCDGSPGACSQSFLPRESVLVHGNELLQEVDQTSSTRHVPPAWTVPI